MNLKSRVHAETSRNLLNPQAQTASVESPTVPPGVPLPAALQALLSHCNPQELEEIAGAYQEMARRLHKLAAHRAYDQQHNAPSCASATPGDAEQAFWRGMKPSWFKPALRAKLSNYSPQEIRTMADLLQKWVRRLYELAVEQQYEQQHNAPSSGSAAQSGKPQVVLGYQIPPARPGCKPLPRRASHLHGWLKVRINDSVLESWRAICACTGKRWDDFVAEALLERVEAMETRLGLSAVDALSLTHAQRAQLGRHFRAASQAILASVPARGN